MKSAFVTPSDCDGITNADYGHAYETDNPEPTDGATDVTCESKKTGPVSAAAIN